MNEENQRRRTRRRERPVKKKKGRILAICLAALVLAGVVYGVHTWADYSGSFQSSAEVTVKIPSGSSGRQIAAQLAEDGIISHKTVFYYYMRMTGAGAGLKPGSYVLRSDLSPCLPAASGKMWHGSPSRRVSPCGRSRICWRKRVSARQMSFWTIWTLPT